jgi:IclR family KDG regulon transcriptional repressor
MTPASKRPSAERYLVRAVERALSILNVLSVEESPNLATISRLIGLPLSTTFRLLATLVAHGYVEQPSHGSHYRLGAACLTLGDAFLKASDLRQRSEDCLVALRDQCGETVHLAVMEGEEVMYLLKLPGLHPIGLMSSRAGGRAPLHCTGLGKALLAFLSSEPGLPAFLKKRKLKTFTPNTLTGLRSLEIDLKRTRKRGYAVDNEEHETGVACIAAPVFGHAGLVAAVSVSGPAARILGQMKDTHLEREVIRTAAEITSKMGGLAHVSAVDG